MKLTKVAILSLACVLILAGSALAQATIEIVNLNAGTGTGFDDPGPAVAAPGNPGKTIGQQRLEAFKEAARIWGETLTSVPRIRILASFEPLFCDSTSAVLGSAGSISSVANFPGAAYPNTWYPLALANKLANDYVLPETGGEIRARFNSNLGNPGCLDGGGWYLGFDGNEQGSQSDLVAVLLHEFAHGLGFASFINKKTGTEFKGWTDIYSRQIQDNWTGINWGSTTPSIRRKTGTAGNIVWTGSNVTTDASDVLSKPPHLRVTAPAGVVGSYPVGTASFGAPVKGSVSGTVVYPANNLACTAVAENLTGKIALVDRGTCSFVVKAKNVQNAGAIGMVVADNDPANTTPLGMSGSDITITIPAVRLTKADGDTIKVGLPTLAAAIEEDATSPTLAGADVQDHVKLYAPPVVAPGSSVSHWDTSAYRNLLMEPFINGDLTHNVRAPYDLTYELLKDIGW